MQNFKLGTFPAVPSCVTCLVSYQHIQHEELLYKKNLSVQVDIIFKPCRQITTTARIIDIENEIIAKCLNN